MALDSLKDITTIASPANGLLVYNRTQPGVRSDLRRGFYYFSANFASWVRLTDNENDNGWRQGGLGLQLKDKADGVEIMDEFLGTQLVFNPKLKVMQVVDSAILNTKNNINVLTLSGVNRNRATSWENRQKTSIVFENMYVNDNNVAASNGSHVAIPSYIEATGSLANSQTNGLAF